MVRMMPVIVVVSVLLAGTVCLLAWVMAGRPTRARARHGIETRRPANGPGLPDEPATLDDRLARARVTGPEDDPEFIRQLARAVAEQGERFRRDGDLPSE